MPSPRSRSALLAGTTVIVVAFAVTVILDRPAGHPSRTPTSSAAASSTGSPPGSGFDGAALPAGVHARNFTLTDQSGHPVSLQSYRGQAVIVAFLYSTCGSTCTLIAQQIRGALDELPRPVPVLLLSVDPRADTPAHVSRFLAQVSLTGRVRYLTGPVSQLRPLWRAYGATPPSSQGHGFESSAAVLLIDRGGLERVLFGLEQLTPEALAHDIRGLESEP
jgi:protein SCO1/2